MSGRPPVFGFGFGRDGSSNGGGSSGGGGPLSACLPLAERLLHTQDAITHLRAQLLAQQPSLSALPAAAPPASHHPEEEEEEQKGGDKGMEDETSSVSPAAAPVVPFSALPLPAALPPQLPALLRSLHDSLLQLHDLLSTAPSHSLALYFDLLYLPLFTVLVSHPKAQEQQAAGPAKSSVGEGRLQKETFPMLPHQDRVWEQALKCLNLLLLAGMQEPWSVRATLNKRFFGMFQLLLNFLPSDFRTIVNATPGEAKRNVFPSANVTGNGSASSSSSSSSEGRIAVWHSEETRVAALTCTRHLFECVHRQFELNPTTTTPSTNGGGLSDIQHLLTTFQLNPSFCISLGYYIHLMLRFASQERSKLIRREGVKAVQGVMGVLQLEVLNRPTSPSSPTTSAAGATPFSPLPGRSLLLSYLPGIMSTLFNLLLFDSAKARGSGGWRFQLESFRLFVEATRVAVRHVAGVKEIVEEVKGVKRKEVMEDVDEEGAAAESDPTADRALAQLSALLPNPSPSPSSSVSSASSSPSFRLSSLHPVLQSVLKPVDAAWWAETRKNIDNIMSRVFTATQLHAHVIIAGEMLEAAKGFLLGTVEEERGVDPALLAQGNTIYTSLLPSSCTITWVEYIILCNEHEDTELRRKAVEIIEQLAAKNGAWASQHARPMMLLPGSSPSASPSSLIPLLTSSLSSHLLRLPRQLPTSSESGQLSLLKTIKGYIDVLGRSSLSSSSSSSSGLVVGSNKSHPLWDFVQGNMERIIKIFERIWEVDSKESKVLEREKEGGKDKPQQQQITQNETSTALSDSSTSLSSSSSISLSLPTYYSFSFLHLHTPAAQTLSLSILHSLGYYLSSHFGLWLAHLHERLVEGVQEVSERGNFSSTNKLKETLLFINMSMLGLGEAIQQGKVQAYELLPHLELLLFDYLQPTLWHLPLDNVLRGSLGLPLLSQVDLSNNLLLVSFLLRGVGDMSLALGEEFRPFLMHLLYPLFEKLGSNHASIHQAALVTLHRVAVACGYEEVARAQSAALASSAPPTADDVLQAMLVENMDYLVEQMAVELRNLNFNQHYTSPEMDPSSASSMAHPLTLPLVLTSLLTRVSLRCTQALIPLLDDILKVILDKLGELSLQEEWREASSSASLPPGLVSSSLSRLAYLEILRSVSRAIRLIQAENDVKHPESIPPKMPAIYASAAPVPLIEATKEQAQLDFVDSMLNLESEEKEEEKEQPQPQPTASHISASIPAPKVSDSTEEKPSSAPLPYFAPLSIRRRLEASIRSKHQQARSRRKEEAWLRCTRAGGAHVEEEKEGEVEDEEEEDEEGEGEFYPSLDGDVPRDSEGRTRAERWFERNEQKRAKAEAHKLNGLAGMGDEEMDAEMDREEKAYKDEPEVPLTPDQQTVLSIFTQCCNYLSTAAGTTSSSQRYTVLCTLSECIPVLQRVPKEFFPEIAKLWPVLQQSLRLLNNAKPHQPEVFSLKGGAAAGGLVAGGGFQNSLVAQAGVSPLESLTSVRVEEGSDGSDQQLVQLINSLATTSFASSADPSSSSAAFTHSTPSPLFIQSLSLLSQLSGCAAKFLAGRFSKEVWPLLQQIMQFEARWMSETRMQRKKGRSQQQQQLYENQLKLLPAYKIQKSVLTTLSHLVRYPDISTQHLPSLCMQLRPYLSSEQPLEFQQLAVRCFETLLQLEADVVWHTLWTLCPSLAMEPYEREQKQTPPAAAVLTSATAHFLSHPCFQQVYPNFDARFLLHQRMQTIPPAPTPVEYEQNVRRLLQNMQRPHWPEPKLTLF